MRILGIDYGTVRTGLALSDELGMLAHPYGILKASSLNELSNMIGAFCSEHDVEKIVIGFPRHMQGDEGTHAKSIKELGRLLELSLDKKVIFFEERLTSTEAHRKMIDADVPGRKKRDKVDSAAAAIILQSYLDSTGAF